VARHDCVRLGRHGEWRDGVVRRMVEKPFGLECFWGESNGRPDRGRSSDGYENGLRTVSPFVSLVRCESIQRLLFLSSKFILFGRFLHLPHCVHLNYCVLESQSRPYILALDS
jgi:hypothetical protein